MEPRPQPERLGADDLPAPIPWLVRQGPVAPLDRPTPAPAATGCGSGTCGCGASATGVETTPPSATTPKLAAAKPGPSFFAKLKKRFGPKRRPGSGIPARKGIRVLMWARRVSQVGF